jgi:transglutaminase-like putative cysteine protease
MRVIRTDRNPFNFLLSENALARPLRYSTREKQALAAYFDEEAARDPVLREAASRFFPNEEETVSFLTQTNTRLHSEISYEPREEPGIFSPAELMERGRGSCRDYAFLLQKVLQVDGFATRFVSGYLLETGEMQGAEAMHAWTEVYLPGAGWIGLDPTNGVLTDDAFIPCAVAINPDDATPIGGRFFAKSAVQSHLSTDLQIHCAEKA